MVVTAVTYERVKDENGTAAATNANVSNDNTNSNTTETDESDWLTYTNDDYGFSFQYPSNWGAVQVNKLDYSDDERSYFSGQAISLTFEKTTSVNIKFESTDYRAFGSLTSYTGGADLSTTCSSPGVIKNFSYCINETVAGQSTFDRLWFTSPECSPMFIRESWLNYDDPVYKGVVISSILFTDGAWDCTSDDQDAWDQITDTELQRLVNRNNLTDKEANLLTGFDHLLSTFRLN